MNVSDALNEYFRLKSEYETINAKLRLKAGSRAEYLKLMPKCINCKRPSKLGTIFTTTFTPASDTVEGYRNYKASCGVVADPCALLIEIHMPVAEPLNRVMQQTKAELDEYKDKVIQDKNRLLFGLLSAEEAVNNFDINKTYINGLTPMYEDYFQQWILAADNPEKKAKLDEKLLAFYTGVDSIKSMMKKMTQQDNPQFAADAASLYINELDPLVKDIRGLKYSKMFVDVERKELVQKPVDEMADLLVSSGIPQVVLFEVGLKIDDKPDKDKKEKKKKDDIDNEINNVVLEKEKDDESDDDDYELMGGNNNGPIKIEIKDLNPIIKNTVVPVINDTDISWPDNKYQSLWKSLPDVLKTEFKVNQEWMKDYMATCIQMQQKTGLTTMCPLTLPPNIVVPPRQTSTGQYDFGVSIYNAVFNRLPENIRQQYLTQYTNGENGTKNYSQMMAGIQVLVSHELGLNK